MAVDLRGIRAVLLDVEGTTTPVSFVHETLFAFARERLAGYLERAADRPAVAEDLAALRREHSADVETGLAPPPWRDEGPRARQASAAAYVRWLMECDRKSTALKSLQGKIWEEGYRSGALRGAVYPDVAPALRRWRSEGRDVAVFSSGSVLAQQLLFRHTPDGDLTPLLHAHFDTTTGSKRESASYGRIAAALEVPPAEVLFVSDVEAELDAARAAGLETALCARDGEAPRTARPVVRSFDELR